MRSPWKRPVDVNMRRHPRTRCSLFWGWVFCHEGPRPRCGLDASVTGKHTARLWMRVFVMSLVPDSCTDADAELLIFWGGGSAEC